MASIPIIRHLGFRQFSPLAVSLNLNRRYHNFQGLSRFIKRCHPCQASASNCTRSPFPTQLPSSNQLSGICSPLHQLRSLSTSNCSSDKTGAGKSQYVQNLIENPWEDDIIIELLDTNKKPLGRMSKSAARSLVFDDDNVQLAQIKGKFVKDTETGERIELYQLISTKEMKQIQERDRQKRKTMKEEGNLFPDRNKNKKQKSYSFEVGIEDHDLNYKTKQVLSMAQKHASIRVQINAHRKDPFDQTSRVPELFQKVRTLFENDGAKVFGIVDQKKTVIFHVKLPTRPATQIVNEEY